MQALKHYGPGLTVLAATAAILFCGPAAIRSLAFARTEAQILQASERLEGDSLLDQLNQSTRDIAVKVEPSVVHISTESRRTDGRGYRMRVGGTGSGWIYDESGHIVTNGHVVEDATRIQVQLHTGELREAKLLGVDLRSDIAVISIPPGRIHAAQRSEQMAQQGDQIFAFGSPFDFRFSMSRGIVSGLGRSAGLEGITYENFIQVDAAINPGNSGGPLTDVHGRVIGMNTAIATSRGASSSAGQSAGIGLAIPIGMIEAVVSQLIENGEVNRGFMGVDLLDIDLPYGQPKARDRGFQGMGVEIRRVEGESPAESAGLLRGDVITHVDGESVGQTGQIRSIVASRSPGETITLSVWRYEPGTQQSSTLEIKVTLGQLDPARIIPPATESLRLLGLQDLATANIANAEKLGTPFRRGVIIPRIELGSLAEKSIPPGSIITEVMGQPVTSLDEFYTRLSRAMIPLLQMGSEAPVSITIMTPDGRELKQELPIVSN